VKSEPGILHRHWRPFFILCSLAVDAAAIAVSGALAYEVRDHILGMHELPTPATVLAVVSSGAALIAFAALLGLYRASYHTSITYQYVLAAKSYLLAIPAVLALFFILHLYQVPRVFVTLFFVIIPAAFAFGRYALHKFSRAMQRRGYGLHRTLLIDHGQSGPFFFHRFDLLLELSYQIVGLATLNGQGHGPAGPGPLRVAHCESWQELKSIIEQDAIDRVIAPSIDIKPELLSDLFHACRDTRAKLKLLSQESEELLRFSYVKDVAGITLYGSPRRRIENAKRVAKRVFDVLGSLAAIVLLSPVLFLASVAILLEDGRPVVYRQRRALVKGCNEFDMFKFRTMVKDAERKQAKLYERNETTGGLFLMKEDPRLLKVGRFLRKLSFDELPQLFNVLRGDMSLVGPRPLSVADLENITPQNRLAGYYELRANALPGMTGLWQISGRREVSFKEMVLLDLYYIENQSVMFDLEILFATIPVVLFGKGAY
jgi:exopolysaccharide biosynthesis polyprenyl glycosylphosphotransferase